MAEFLWWEESGERRRKDPLSIYGSDTAYKFFNITFSLVVYHMNKRGIKPLASYFCIRKSAYYELLCGITNNQNPIIIYNKK